MKIPSLDDPTGGSAELFIDKKMPKRPSWDTPVKRLARKRADLFKHLCDVGERTDGGACPGCPSQCAFGREYARHYKPRPGMVKPPRASAPTDRRGKKSSIGAFDTYDQLVHVFPHARAAAEYLGCHINSIMNTLNKTPHLLRKGYRLAWLDNKED